MTRNIDINEDLLLWKPLDMCKLREYLNVHSILDLKLQYQYFLINYLKAQ